MLSIAIAWANGNRPPLLFKTRMESASRHSPNKTMRLLAFVAGFPAWAKTSVSVPEIDSREDDGIYTQFVSASGSCANDITPDVHEDFPLDENQIWSVGERRFDPANSRSSQTVFSSAAIGPRILSRRDFSWRGISVTFPLCSGPKRQSKSKIKRRNSIVGTIGVTHARYGNGVKEKLPMAASLGLDLPRPKGKERNDFRNADLRQR